MRHYLKELQLNWMSSLNLLRNLESAFDRFSHLLTLSSRNSVSIVAASVCENNRVQTRGLDYAQKYSRILRCVNYLDNGQTRKALKSHHVLESTSIVPNNMIFCQSLLNADLALILFPVFSPRKFRALACLENAERLPCLPLLA